MPLKRGELSQHAMRTSFRKFNRNSMIEKPSDIRIEDLEGNDNQSKLKGKVARKLNTVDEDYLKMIQEFKRKIKRNRPKKINIPKNIVMIIRLIV